MFTFNNITADSFAADTQHGAGRRRPRHREALSCSQCRDRKVRCDRKQPCRQCQARNLSSNCSYGTSRDHGSFSHHHQQQLQQQQQMKQQPPPPPPRKPHTAPPSPSSSTSGESADVRKRLERLESLLAASASSAPPSESVGRGPSSTAANTPLHNNATTIALHLQERSSRSTKTRLVSGTHWLAVCDNMIVLRAMLSKSSEFSESRKSFAEIKAWTKSENSTPPHIPGMITDVAGLYALLPSRNVCEAWIRTYAQTYRQVYDIVDEVTLESAMSSVWAPNATDNPATISLILLVVSIGMQADEPERLTGRGLARQVELYAFTSNYLNKPCVSSMMVLLLLGFIKTLACSDTESLDSLAGIFGLTHQVALAMGLDRTPTFLGDIGPYHGEIRKRLWGIFFRMYFNYCMTIGVPCPIREEDTTTGLPLNVNLAEIAFETGNDFPVKEMPQQTEATFSIIATKLAYIAATYQRAICCANGGLTPDSVHRIGEQFKALLANAPTHLQPGYKTADSTEEIQQAFITVTIHSVSLMVSLHFVLKGPPESSQKAHLHNVWDHALSVIHSFQGLSKKTARIQTVSYQLLWSEACRAAFSASMVLNRLRIIEMRSIMATRPQHTLIPFQESLLKYLTFMSRFWFRSAHLGPVASKNCLLLAVIVAVTAKLFAEEEGSSEQDLIEVGARSVEQAVESMKMAMQRRYSFPMSPEPSLASPNVGNSLVRMISTTDRSISSPDLVGTWRSTSSVLETPSAPISVPVSASSAPPTMDPFAQSIGTMYGHPFIQTDGHSLGYNNNNEFPWPMDQYDLSQHPTIAGLTIQERNPNTHPVFMDGLISPGPDWQTSQWIDDMGLQYSHS